MSIFLRVCGIFMTVLGALLFLLTRNDENILATYISLLLALLAVLFFAMSSMYSKLQEQKDRLDDIESVLGDHYNAINELDERIE